MNRPRPVLTNAGIASAVTSAAGIAAFLGYDKIAAHLSAEAGIIGSVVIAALAHLPALTAALRSEKVVTPLSDPRTDGGISLAPVAGSAAPAASTATSVGSASDIVNPFVAAS